MRCAGRLALLRSDRALRADIPNRFGWFSGLNGRELLDSIPGVLVKGALPSTPGRFNFGGSLGLDGANAACNTNFMGTHACSLEELKTSTTPGDLKDLKDITNMAVTSFWAIDSTAPPLQQCNDDAVGGSGINWEYATAHTASRGEKVDLDSNGNLVGLDATGKPDAAHMGLQCNFSGNAWVACCQ